MNREFKFTYFSNVDSRPHLLNLIGKTRWEVTEIDFAADGHWGIHKQVLEARGPQVLVYVSVSYTHLTLPTIYSV